MLELSRFVPRCQRCTSEEQLHAFQRNFQHYSGNPVDLDYLQAEKTQTIALYWRRRMIGGYVLRQGPELRYRDILIRAGGAWPEHPQTSDCAELCCSWLAHRHTLLSMLMFCDTAQRLQKLPQSYLVGGSRIPAVVAAHRPFFPYSICSTTRETQGRIERWSFYYTEARQFNAKYVALEALRRLTQAPLRMRSNRRKTAEWAPAD